MTETQQLKLYKALHEASQARADQLYGLLMEILNGDRMPENEARIAELEADNANHLKTIDAYNTEILRLSGVAKEYRERMIWLSKYTAVGPSDPEALKEWIDEQMVGGAET